MSEYYEGYTEGPEKNSNYKDTGTAPMVLGLLSIIFSLTFSRIVGLVLGIIAVVMSGRTRKENTQANAGFVMGIIGICISSVLLSLILFGFIMMFASTVMFF